MLNELYVDQEVHNNYGAKPNDELLLGYGFVIKDNPEDFVSLLMCTSGDSIPAKILTKVGIPLTTPHYIKRDIEHLPLEILAQLRVLVADEQELQTLQLKASEADGSEKDPFSQDWQGVLGFVSWANEIEMLEQLGDMLDMKAKAVEQALIRSQDCISSLRSTKRRKKELDGLVQACQEGIREDIRNMIEIYLDGKHLLLRDSLN